MRTASGLKAVLAVATPLLALATANSASAGARAPVSSMLHNTAGAPHPRVDATMHAAAQEEPLISAGAEVAAGGAGEAAVAVTGGQAVEQRRASVGVLGVLGGALCHLVLGTTYCWGNFVPYVPEKLKCFGSAPGCSHASYILPATFVSQTLAMPLGPYFQDKIGCQATTALGCGIMALGVFLSSYAPNLATFMFCYSFMFGSGIGLAYTAPMVNGWRWFPSRKGMVSGAVVAGFGAGGFVFNQVGTGIINPKGLDAVGGVYPDEVYANFPVMLRKLALIYFLVAALGATVIKPPPVAAAPEGSRNNRGRGKVQAAATETSLKQVVKDKRFWLMWFMALMIGTSGINVANCYKQYGGSVDILKSDQFQSFVGSVAALCNAAGRLFWGNLLDVVNFKSLFAALAVLQGSATAFYTVLSQSKAGYLVGTGTLLFCLGGNFAMFPALCSKVFGGAIGAKVYGVLFTAFAVASISGTFLTKSLMAMDWSWEQIFQLMAFLSMCSITALPFFKM
ncbi:unnamed protein product [Ectocarpus sp. 4 AP-2014]